MGEPLICYECGSVLTDEERYWYAGRCETCEVAWSDRLTAWRKGADDPELDTVYSIPAPTLQ